MNHAGRMLEWEELTITEKFKIEKVSPHQSGIFALATGRYGEKELLVTGSLDGKIKVYQINEKNLLKLGEASHTAEVRCACVINSKLLSGDSKGHLRVWSWPKCDLIHKEAKAHQTRVICITPFIYHDTCLSSSTLLCFKAFFEANPLLKLPKPLQRKICENMFHHFCVTGSADKKVKLWEIKENGTLQLFLSFSEHKNHVNDCAQVDSETLVSVGADSRIIFWSRSQKKRICTVEHPSNSILCVEIVSIREAEHSRDFLLTGDYSKKLVLWDLNTTKNLCSLNFEAPIGCMMKSPNNPTILFVGCDDSSIKIVQLISKKGETRFSLLETLKAHRGWLTGVAKIEECLFTVSTDGLLVRYTPLHKDSISWLK